MPLKKILTGIVGEIIIKMTNPITSPSAFKLICGLEIHAELKTKSKMFCGCKNDPFGAAEPNIYTCPVCLGMPGALPVANKTAIEWIIKLGLALNCQINLFSKFDRKHYFYPDLPKGYQISQYDIPFCYDGYIETSEGKIRIRRIHLEEDTGKLLHKTVDGKKVTLVDFNRSSVPLVEIVTEPDIKTASQAKEYGKKLRQVLRYLDIADCDMEQGGMRLEANTSLIDQSAPDGELPNYKVEVKNINSFRFLEQAINFEVKRQTPILLAGDIPAQETRGWNAAKQETFSQRTKEDAEDYRYFPDPDLPPFRFTAAQIEQWKNELPELPAVKAQRWLKEFGIEVRFSELLVDNKKQAEWFEQLFTQAQQQQLDLNKLASMITNKKIVVNFDDSQSSLIQLFKSATTNDSIDESALLVTIQDILSANPKEVTAYKAGKETLVNFFIGQVMKTLKAKIDIEQVKNILIQELNK
jgi:aspartyl-tRNA(Asn)/glutamyl-tRNA(Gln) amidotransferase subunit B